jgi:hypothetical protein
MAAGEVKMREMKGKKDVGSERDQVDVVERKLKSATRTEA